MLRDRLRRLYGAQAGDRAAQRLEALLADFRARRPGAGDRRPGFDQSDVLLITYGDTIQDPPSPPLAALRRFAERHLDGRLSTVHLLPFFPYSSDYGFAVTDHTQVDPDLGDWDDVAALGSDFKLMFDFVLNHVSAESSWFQAFRRGEPPYDEYFITLDPATDLSSVTRPRSSPLLTRVETAGGPCWVWTTFGPDQVDLDYRNPEVLLRMVRVMLDYVARGAGLLRLDAVGFLWKEVGTTCMHLPQTHELVKLFRDVLDRAAPEVAIVTETNVPQGDNVTYFGNGRDEAQMVYQFPLAPLVLDAFARADARHLAGWARGLPAPSVRTTFLNFLASHDGIGVVPAKGILSDAAIADLAARVRAAGGEVSYKRDPDGGQSPYELNSTFFDALSGPDGAGPWATALARFLCSQAIMLALAGVPAVYVQSLFGSHNDRPGFARSGWKRDLNHRRLRLDVLERALADPLSGTARVFSGLARLLELRRAQPAFHPGSPQRVLDLPPAVFGLRRGPWQEQTLLVLHNLAEAAVELPAAVLGGAPAAGWIDLVSGRRCSAGEALALPAYAVRWLRPAPSR